MPDYGMVLVHPTGRKIGILNHEAGPAKNQCYAAPSISSEISLFPKANSGTAYNMVGAAVKGISDDRALTRALREERPLQKIAVASVPHQAFAGV
jgi:hypothetical protein